MHLKKKIIFSSLFRFAKKQILKKFTSGIFIHRETEGDKKNSFIICVPLRKTHLKPE